ncbi:aminotransferase class III-fold pyridoxal phosphate-dependent enzyme [Micrococcus sp. R8502A1]|uniref:aminotransferase class III-fold pyridoxal phosphate-dependent enzyme n=1 Tax=Micrococcus sp. R8502A1 TaxID=2583239 RepID=UPI00210662E2|nr:aminotransferase class III-fold pyridoxal phosphate-dependent enzyme [Micrococcus sp. R8502A1]
MRGARGVHLDLEGPGGERHRAIDAMASWWSVVHGHGPPALVEALTRQAAAFPHVMFGGLTPAPAVDLAERLVAPPPAAPERALLAPSRSGSGGGALQPAPPDPAPATRGGGGEHGGGRRGEHRTAGGGVGQGCGGLLHGARVGHAGEGHVASG